MQNQKANISPVSKNRHANEPRFNKQHEMQEKTQKTPHRFTEHVSRTSCDRDKTESTEREEKPCMNPELQVLGL